MISRIAGLVFACTVCSSALAAPLYKYSVTKVQIVELGTLGGAQSAALDINDSGEIVGWSATSQGGKNAFRYSDGLMDDLGSGFVNSQTSATGINASGKVVGTMTYQVGYTAVMWDSGSVRVLLSPIIDESPGSTSASAISNIDQISSVDQICGNTEVPAPFMTAGSTWMIFPKEIQLGLRRIRPGFVAQVPHGGHFCNDLNSSGSGVGRLGSNEPWRWDLLSGAREAKAVPPPANSAETPTGDALGINERGDVVGFFNLQGLGDRAYVWDGVSPNSQDLGVLPSGTNSVADDINELRFIAGRADERFVQFPFDWIRERAFLYHTDFGFYVLPLLPGSGLIGSCRAAALNQWKSSTGVIQVVGTCQSSSGSRAVRWDVVVTRTRFTSR